MTFQVAPISYTMAAVLRIVGGGKKVVFDSPKVGSEIEGISTRERTYLRQSNGIYYMDTWAPPNDSDFHKQRR